MVPAASDAPKLRGFVDGLDEVDGMDVVTMLSRLTARALRLWYATVYHMSNAEQIG